MECGNCSRISTEIKSLGRRYGCMFTFSVVSAHDEGNREVIERQHYQVLLSGGRRPGEATKRPGFSSSLEISGGSRVLLYI